MTNPVSADELRRQLDAIKKKRGYVLPHHGLLAATSPALLESYDATYTALTLSERTISDRVKEFVWIAILVATDEAIASHHIKRLRDAGGSDGDFDAAIRLSAFGRSAPGFRFPAQHWGALLPHYDRERAYVSALDALCTGLHVDPPLVEMTMAAVQTCLFHHFELAFHLRRAYAARVPEIELAEALALTMFPGSVPYYVEAAGVWRDLIVKGEVPASETFKLWAEAVSDSRERT